jgi:hypothetical protein
MRYLPLILLAGAGAGAGAAVTAPLPALQPMAFLVGHCWSGDVPATLSHDEHCFAWVLDGQAVRETRTLRTPGQPDHVSETTYYWDPVHKSAAYLYLDNGGGFSQGSMETTANTLYVPAAPRTAGEEVRQQRMRWTPQGENAYQAWTEARGKQGNWFTVFEMTMTRTR